MKKYLRNIFNLRLLMMAAFAAACGTSWSQVEDSPLEAWWDEDAGGYVLRSLDNDDEHTIIDAMKALQTINSDKNTYDDSGSWYLYSAYTFYLAEDVDFDNYKDDEGKKLNWEPLGTADNPFQSFFYCYAPSRDSYGNPDYSSLDELGYDKANSAYISTDGHIGTCKISNMNVEGEYENGAGFFGVVNSSAFLYGFTFVNCSVKNNAEEGYAGILYGISNDENDRVPTVQDLFIGTSTKKCSVTAAYPGGVYGQNLNSDGGYIDDTSFDYSTGLYDSDFTPALDKTYSSENPSGAIDDSGNSINKIYVTVTAKADDETYIYGDKISATMSSTEPYDYCTYVDATLSGHICGWELKDITQYEKASDANILATDFTEHNDENDKGQHPEQTVYRVTYTRKHHNDWETVTLPFDYTLNDIQNSDKFVAYTFESAKNNISEDNDETITTDISISFTKYTGSSTAIEKGTPMLFYNKDKANTDFVVQVTDPTAVVVTTEAKSVGEEFKGVLQTTGTDGFGDVTNKFKKSAEYMYKIKGAANADGSGTLLQCNSNSWVYPFRAYLDLSSYFSSGSAKSSLTFSISDGEGGNPTKLEMVNGELVERPAGAVYSLDGRKVSDNGMNGLKPGLYISGGKKYVVK